MVHFSGVLTPLTKLSGSVHVSDKETHAPAICYSLLLERYRNLVSDIATPSAAVCSRDSCVHDLQWKTCTTVSYEGIWTLV